MRGCFCIKFINFMFKGKSLIDIVNLFQQATLKIMLQ